MHNREFGPNPEGRLLPPVRDDRKMLFVADGRRGKTSQPQERVFGKDTPVSALSELKPGDVIRFADIRELHEFEGVLATFVDPEHNRKNWAGRQKLRDLLRPPKFNGTIRDIRLTVMDKPHERLLDARERGWRLRRGNYSKFQTEAAASIIEKMIGFTFTANASSSRKRNAGQIQAEIWYYPIPPVLLKAGHQKRVRRYSDVTHQDELVVTRTLKEDSLYRLDRLGKGIIRVVTHPRIDTGKFIQHDADSRQVGSEVWKRAISHPFKTPMQN